MASEAGLWVILCPGPYVGGDLDLGGLPSWLLRDPKMKLRTTYKGFTKAVNHYFDKIIPMIVQLQGTLNMCVQQQLEKIQPFPPVTSLSNSHLLDPQYAKGGPIIAVQVENEYGSYHQDKRYLKYIKKALVTRGIKVLLMTGDDGEALTRGHLTQALSTVHMRHIKKETYDTLFSLQGRSPILMMVYTARSLDGWGTAPHSADSHMLKKEVREMFNASFSLNFYMFHGGTNFGFMGGSASLDNYLPMITSYDYGALLTENGEYTPEYFSYQDFFSFSLGIPKHPQPDSIPKATYKSVITPYYISLWDVMPYLEEPISSVKPICMEKLSVNQGSGQSSGYVLYETMIISGGLLTTKGHLQDRGQVFVDDIYIGILDHSTNHLTIPTKMVYKNNPTLRILVENQGRLAYGQDINKERKGLIGDIYLNNSPLRKFKIYSLDMKTKFLRRDLPNIWKPVVFKHQGPAFFLGILRMGNYPRDTFIKMEGWTKGVIFINGQNLGRYWNIGPQETLYLPGPWLRPGSNEIIVFEEFKPGLQIHFTNMSHLGMVPWRANCSI
uniref:beta-galactosidase-1-like protein 2 isoform X2 n=1 Tax=Nyctereutes procyonoides TaxID=34880 RepID=UPI002443E034|nr:beta-galactosidase-1-like protein 2 isoform X2 [Nyctereutes procyonoides]XP_055161550.1 beta-galactosidase-1-like protein 2 isoform X2 [Nyctereutes procyonoides]